jgi:hypothetical protein
MIVESRLPFVLVFDAFDLTIPPGRTAIPDNVGRKLVQSKAWKEQLATKHPNFSGKVKVIVEPAEDPEELAKAGKAPKVKPAIDHDKGGESAVANMKMADAIKHIRMLDVVDAIQQIEMLDPREEIKDACRQRVEDLAKIQKSLDKKELTDGDEPEGLEGDGSQFPDDKRIT